MQLAQAALSNARRWHISQREHPWQLKLWFGKGAARQKRKIIIFFIFWLSSSQTRASNLSVRLKGMFFPYVPCCWHSLPKSSYRDPDQARRSIQISVHPHHRGPGMCRSRCQLCTRRTTRYATASAETSRRSGGMSDKTRFTVCHLRTPRTMIWTIVEAISLRE